MGASAQMRELAARSRQDLEALLQAGTAPAVESLHGRQYMGFNQPRSAELIRSRKFFKGFFTEGGRTHGYNVRAKQNGLEGEWLPRAAQAEPFAFFSVESVREGMDDAKYPNALLLDYRKGQNAALDPAKSLRDYLVRVNSDSDDLLLGKAYLALGAARLRVGFFFLERHQGLDVDPEALRR